jgi:hypothetical protein
MLCSPAGYLGLEYKPSSAKACFWGIFLDREFRGTLAKFVKTSQVSQ